HQPFALPTNRIVMVDVRNLDPAEEQLIAATDVTVVRPGDSLTDAITRLAEDTDFIYLHMDVDILDSSLVPTHPTREPNGPSVADTLNAVATVLDSGKVGALALVAVFAEGPEGPTTMNSASELLRGSLSAWRERVEVPA
ncbi:MAG TPA: arginase family protein, partial [Thermomicrobiaceae bacterium]|nr:arginase family protein [Thermomicrobiaceae bacterium]